MTSRTDVVSISAEEPKFISGSLGKRAAPGRLCTCVGLPIPMQMQIRNLDRVRVSW